MQQDVAQIPSLNTLQKMPAYTSDFEPIGRSFPETHTTLSFFFAGALLRNLFLAAAAFSGAPVSVQNFAQSFIRAMRFLNKSPRLYTVGRELLVFRLAEGLGAG